MTYKALSLLFPVLIFCNFSFASEIREMPAETQTAKRLPHKEAQTNRRELNQIKKLFEDSGLLKNIDVKAKFRSPNAVNDIITTLVENVQNSENITVSEKADILKLFISDPRGKAVLQRYADEPFMENVMFAYYKCFSDYKRLKLDRRKKKEAQLQTRLPLIPGYFRSFISQKCRESGIRFSFDAFSGTNAIQSVISRLGKISADIKHLDFNAIDKNRKIANDLGLLFDCETGELCTYLKKNEEVTVFNYALVLSSFIQNRYSAVSSVEDVENAKKIINVMQYFFNETDIVSEKFDKISFKRQGQAYFVYSNALKVAQNPVYEKFARKLILGKLRYDLMKKSSSYQQLSIRLDYAQHLYNNQKFLKALYVLTYYKYSISGRRIFSSLNKDARKRIINLQNQCCQKVHKPQVKLINNTRQQFTKQSTFKRYQYVFSLKMPSINLPVHWFRTCNLHMHKQFSKVIQLLKIRCHKSHFKSRKKRKISFTRKNSKKTCSKKGKYH